MRRFGSAMLVPFPLGPAPGPGGRRAPSGPSALVAGSVAVTLTRHLTRSIAGSRTRDRQQVSAAAPELLRESFSICSGIFHLAMIGKITAAEGYGVQAGAVSTSGGDEPRDADLVD